MLFEHILPNVENPSARIGLLGEKLKVIVVEVINLHINLCQICIDRLFSFWTV